MFNIMNKIMPKPGKMPKKIVNFPLPSRKGMETMVKPLKKGTKY